MTCKIGDVITIEKEEPAPCEACGEVAELRPYGPGPTVFRAGSWPHRIPVVKAGGDDVPNQRNEETMKLANYEAWIEESTRGGWGSTLLIVDQAVRALVRDLGELFAGGLLFVVTDDLREAAKKMLPPLRSECARLKQSGLTSRLATYNLALVEALLSSVRDALVVDTKSSSPATVTLPAPETGRTYDVREVEAVATTSLDAWIRDNTVAVETLAPGHPVVRGSATLLRAAVNRDLKVFRDRIVSANRALCEAQTHRASLGENLRLRGLYGSCTPQEAALGHVEHLTPEDVALGHIDRLLLELQEAKKTSRTTSEEGGSYGG